MDKAIRVVEEEEDAVAPAVSIILFGVAALVSAEENRRDDKDVSPNVSILLATALLPGLPGVMSVVVLIPVRALFTEKSVELMRGPDRESIRVKDTEVSVEAILR